MDSFFIKFQKPECHADGLKLRISSGITFADWTLPSKWFSANVKINELIMQCRNFDVIQANAFDCEAFHSIEKLTLSFPSTIILNSNTFNGLNSLKSLIVEGSSLRGFESDTLNSVSQTLNELTLIENNKFSSPLLIDGLTGGTSEMIALKNVKFNHNLGITITARTFSALAHVVTLDLSSCQIVSVGRGAFDAISSTIQSLNLSKNKLITIPVGLFDRMLPAAVVQINIDDNQWQCDCDLCYLQWSLSTNLNFGSNIVACRNPIELRGQNIKTTQFCFDVDCNEYNVLPPTKTLPTTTLPPTTVEIATPPPSTTTNIDLNTIEKKCYADGTSHSYEAVHIQSPDQILKITNISASEVAVHFDSFDNNIALIWFENSEPLLDYNAETVHCRINEINGGAISQTVFVGNLSPNNAYIFCVMDKKTGKVSPLSCISYIAYKRENPPVAGTWITSGNEVLIISLMVLGSFISVIFGMLFGYLILRQYPTLLKGAKNVVIVKSARDVGKSNLVKNIEYVCVYSDNGFVK